MPPDLSLSKRLRGGNKAGTPDGLRSTIIGFMPRLTRREDVGQNRSVATLQPVTFHCAIRRQHELN